MSVCDLYNVVEVLTKDFYYSIHFNNIIFNPMKKYILILIAITLFFTACEKSKDIEALPSPSIQLEKDVNIIDKFIADNNLSVTNLSGTGIYYHIYESGDLTIRPNPSSTITARYTGRLLDGSTFTYQESAKFELRYALPGFQLGLPLVGKGGKIRLILPSGYAYDRQGFNNKLVAPNQVVDYEIELLDVK